MADVVSLDETDRLAWLRAAATEARKVIEVEPSAQTLQKCIDFLNGKETKADSARFAGLSRTRSNRMRKVVMESVSAMTDVRPVFNFETYDFAFKDQAELLNKLTKAWWANSNSDLRLQEALKFGCMGTGYIHPRWNPNLPGGGDIELIPLDPRDVLPIRPLYTESLQQWQGVMIRQKESVNNARRMWSLKAESIEASSVESWFGPDERGASNVSPGAVITPTNDYLFNTNPKRAVNASSGYVEIIRSFIKDNTRNTSDKPVTMGNPDTGTSYVVYPMGSIHPITGKRVEPDQAMLYPRGRLIIHTPDVILEDLPNPYWHGMFPLVKFTLDPVPWNLLGLSMVADLMPLNDLLIEALRGLSDGARKWIFRDIKADKETMATAQIEKMNIRAPGEVYKLPHRVGTEPVFEMMDGPEPRVFDVFLKIIEWSSLEIEDLAGTRSLRELTQQMKQMPSADSMERYMEALSPLLKMRARNMEVALCELAEQVKVMFFQFYDTKRRLEILGPDGLTIDDFDYDPGNLLPAMHPKESDYRPELNFELPKMERAASFHRNFTFRVAKNSFLNISHMGRQMLMLQLWGRNAIDPYTLWESFDLPNLGPEPARTLPDRIKWARENGYMPGPPPEVAQAQVHAAEMSALAQAMQAQLALMQGTMALNGQGPPPGEPGAPPSGGGPPSPGGGGGEQKAPSTSGVGPHGGRPPSGAQPPQMVIKQGAEGPRPTVSESGR